MDKAFEDAERIIEKANEIAQRQRVETKDVLHAFNFAQRAVETEKISMIANEVLSMLENVQQPKMCNCEACQAANNALVIVAPEAEKK